MKQADFVAELHYLTTAEGGRKTPVWSGYRPQVKFSFSDMQTSGQQTFINKETVFPGENVLAEIAMFSTNFFRHKLSIGMPFDFREASRVIGTGKIVEIRNSDLIA